MKTLYAPTLTLTLSLLSLIVSFAQDATTVYNKVIGSTVTIETDNGQGSGFVFLENNLVVTNWHVLEGSSSADVIPNNSNNSYKVLGIVAADVDADIAIIRIQAFWKTPLRAATSTNIGQVVYAIGSPKGMRATISNGILSGENSSHLQTTAAISPGSSGGPLVDSYGYVVGVNVAKVRDAENLNLTIPINKVLALQSEIRATPIALSDFNKMVGTTVTEDTQEEPVTTEKKFYELNWKYSGTAYQAILVMDSEEKNDKVIVRFYNTQKQEYIHVVQELTRDKFEGNLILKGENPTDLLTKKQVNYTPDNFYLQQTDNGTNIYIYDGTKDQKGKLVIESVSHQKLSTQELKRLLEKWEK